MKELNKFLDMVTNNEFVEAHEVLEDRWREWKNNPSQREESFILKGLINGTTALALKVMKKDAPANQVWKTYKKYEPLIEKINSIHTPMYKKAQQLLLKKYAFYFTCKDTER
jgi:formyltetrahydrofolate synthetase